MFRSKTTTVPIGAILLVLFPLVSGLRFKSNIAPYGLHAFGVVTNRLRLQQHLSVDNGVRTTSLRTQDHSDTGTLATAGCPSNLTEVVRGCYRCYLQAYDLGIDPSGNLPPFYYHFDTIQNSSQSLRSICRSFNFLYDCIKRGIASALMPHCMNEENLSALTSSNRDAFGYSTIFAQLEYSCGQGFTVLEANEQCMAEFANNETVLDELHLCMTSGQVVDTDMCNDSVIAARCVNQLYGGVCGTPCGHAMCEVQVNIASYKRSTIGSTCLERIRAECSANDFVAASSTEQMTTPLQPLAPAP